MHAIMNLPGGASVRSNDSGWFVGKSYPTDFLTLARHSGITSEPPQNPGAKGSLVYSTVVLSAITGTILVHSWQDRGLTKEAAQCGSGRNMISWRKWQKLAKVEAGSESS